MEHKMYGFVVKWLEDIIRHFVSESNILCSGEATSTTYSTIFHLPND